MASKNKLPATGPRYVWLVGLVVGIIGGAVVAIGLSQFS